MVVFCKICFKEHIVQKEKKGGKEGRVIYVLKRFLLESG